VVGFRNPAFARLAELTRDQSEGIGASPKEARLAGMIWGTEEAVPWKESSTVQQREKFIEDWLKHHRPLVELCQEFGISRKTGWKWISRFMNEGLPGLVDRSHRPHVVPHAVDEKTIEALIALRKRFPLFGPKKMRAWLEKNEPQRQWPAASTIGAVLKTHGLIEERRRRIRTPMPTQPLSMATAPNVLWCTDFKGCFRVGGSYCHPLTLSDGFSRYLLRVQAVAAERFELVRPIYESAFREFGLPLRIRSDNGAPFAAQAIGGLSRLSVWWLKLGITPERIKPGHPEQNGQHERMHRTLKAQTASPPRPNAEQQQRAFDEFVAHFNNERPHEALNQQTPASVYAPSSRQFPTEVGEPCYPTDFQVRRITKSGVLKFASSEVGVGSVLSNEAIGIEEIGEGRWQLWFGPIYLGLLTQLANRKVELLKNLPDGEAAYPRLS